MSDVYLGYVRVGDIEYGICDDGAYAKTYFYNEETEENGMEVILPEYVMFEGKKYDVLGAYDEFFLEMDDYPQYNYVNKMYFPKTIKYINDYSLEKLYIKHFEIDKDNPNFYLLDNIIYNKKNNKNVAILHIVKKWRWEK